MKKKIMYVLALALLCSLSINSFCQNEGSIPCDKLPQKSTPAMAVTDFANILDAGAKQQMEQELRTYWNSTSIAVAVVTVQNMDGNEVSEYATSLFRCWGIGSAATNRGVLLLISMDEHKIWIQTGYGVEGILPDVTCANICKEYVTPLFKEKKYSDGVVAGVAGIMKTLGTMSWEERMEAIAKEKAAEDKKMREFWAGFMNVILALLGIGLIIFLVRTIMKNIEKAKVRKKLKALGDQMLKEVTAGRESIAALKKEYEHAPVWAQKEMETHTATAYSSLSAAQSLIERAINNHTDHIESAHGLFLEAHSMIEKSHGNFMKASNGIKQKIVKFSTEAPKHLADAKSVVEKNHTDLTALVKQGYRLGYELSEQEDFKKMIAEYEASISDPNEQQKIYSRADIIKEKSAESMSRVLEMIGKRARVAKGLETMKAEGGAMYQKIQSAIALLPAYKTIYAPSVWAEKESALLRLLPKFEVQKVYDTHSRIAALNSMETPSFADAATSYDAFVSLLEDATAACNTVHAIQKEQEEQKEWFPAEYDSASKKIASALEKIKDSDVSEDAKQTAKSAQKKLSEARIMSKRSMLDWVLLMALVNEAAELAKNAENEAKRNIAYAAEKRENARLAQLRSKPRRNSSNIPSGYTTAYTQPSYISSNNNSDYTPQYSAPTPDPTPDFGGFGGGDTGGGGGGSDW